MRRKGRPAETKVWHDPLVTPVGRNKQDQPPAEQSAESTDSRQTKHAQAPKRTGARIVTRSEASTDPHELERERLLQRLLDAEGRPSISGAADAYLANDFALPLTQDVWLQLLEHQDETMVARAIENLSLLLVEEPPKRRAVLESRLRRIEEFADEVDTQAAAGRLRRDLSTLTDSL